MTYEEAQTALRKRVGIDESPASLIEKWSYLVTQAEDGYSWDFSEYLNELQPRDALELILSDPELMKYQEHKELAHEVSALDERFRKLLRDDVELEHEKNWWRRGVLRLAGSPYVEYMRDAHGIQVDLRD